MREVIETADWVIDLGPGVADGTQSQRGDKGGEIVAEGTPEQVAKEPRSYTGHYLAPLPNNPAYAEERSSEAESASRRKAKKARQSPSMRQREAAE
jgi:excinuclease ABC subunit A